MTLPERYYAALTFERVSRSWFGSVIDPVAVECLHTTAWVSGSKTGKKAEAARAEVVRLLNKWLEPLGGEPIRIEDIEAAQVKTPKRKPVHQTTPFLPGMN